jgi:predicted aspartyl protease
MVSARINGATSVDLLLDTGADRTVMSPRVFAAAGISLSRGVGTGSIRGATGTANVTAVPIESIEVGEAKVGRMVVISHDIEQGGIDGLLGRDFLDQFNVNVDNAQGVVTLTPKK